MAVQTVKVVSGTLERTIRVAGQTSARNYANIIAPLLRGPDSRGSLILQKMLKSGTPVKKGDLLAQIDAQTAQDHIEDTTDTVEQAQNDVKKRVAEQAVDWEKLQQTVRVAKAEFDKAVKEAQAAEVRTVVDQELLKLSVEEYEARYKQALADLPFEKKSQRAELRILEITNIRQDRHLERHVVDIKKYTILAPMNGMAVAQSIWRGGDMAQTQEGDQVYPGQPIAKVVDLSSMQVEGIVNQTESDEFRIGQPAKITLDAFPGAELNGKVYSIGALAVGGRMQNYYIRNIPVRVMIRRRRPAADPGPLGRRAGGDRPQRAKLDAGAAQRGDAGRRQDVRQREEGGELREARGSARHAQRHPRRGACRTQPRRRSAGQLAPSHSDTKIGQEAHKR